MILRLIYSIFKLFYYVLLLTSIVVAKNNHVTCQQIADVVDNGQRYMQFVFTDSSGNYTAGYLESYDDPGKGSFVSYIHPISVKNKSALQMQQLQQLHSASIARMKQHSLALSSVTQRQQVDQLFLQNRISSEQAMAYYQQIEYAPLVSQATKQAQTVRKKNKKKQTAVSEKKSQPKLPQQVTKKSNIASQEIQKLREHNNNQVARVACNQDSSYQQVMDKRSKALSSSIEHQTPTAEHVKIKSQTAAFLQAQKIDILQFQQSEGLQIQHQLTHELIDILDAVVQYAQQHQYEMYQTHLTKYCAHLASLSQQANQQGALQQAIEGTNCCHGIMHYLQGMVLGVAQAYQQFQTALDYFDMVVDRYGNLIVQHAVQGAMIAHGLEAIMTVGIIAAPTATVAATGIMIGTTAYVMAPLCAQAMIDTASFGGACITGNWDKVATDLDNFGTFISSPQTIARMAELAGGVAMPTPNLNFVVDQVLSLRPVLTRVKHETGQTISKLYVMSKDKVQQVYQQSVELLQLPEFINFNVKYEKILATHFFDILPKSHPVLAGALSGLENGVMNSAEQTMMTQLFTQADSAAAGQVIKNEVMHAAYPIIENVTKSASLMQNIVQQEIQTVLQQGNKIVNIDLFAPIDVSRAQQLADLSTIIRQLQDLAKYTDNFKRLENLIAEDICYLNRIYELQPYRAQIKNFLEMNKPYFIYEGQQYFIEDIASYHIHAGEYLRKEKPKGGHSNYGGHKLDCFKPEVIKHGPIEAKDVLFYNSRNINLTKPSSIYPELWSEFLCDLKAIEVMTSGNAVIEIDLDRGVINFEGCTSEGLNIRIGYDIKAKRIKTHYPKFD